MPYCLTQKCYDTFFVRCTYMLSTFDVPPRYTVLLMYIFTAQYLRPASHVSSTVDVHLPCSVPLTCLLRTQYSSLVSSFCALKTRSDTSIQGRKEWRWSDGRTTVPAQTTFAASQGCQRVWKVNPFFSGSCYRRKVDEQSPLFLRHTIPQSLKKMLIQISTCGIFLFP